MELRPELNAISRAYAEAREELLTAPALQVRCSGITRLLLDQAGLKADEAHRQGQA
jgi:hypothetical protein